jgi:hypothetical protein
MANTIPTNANNLSDYDTPSTDLFNLLPQPYRSDTNRAVMSNLFNRYLSKNQTVEVIGYIGEGNPSAVRTRQIVEPTVGRQAYQLQPLLYEKIGSVEYITSWQDILDELTAQGVDINNLPIWGNATIFNWAPPIDISKIVNYTDYYWVDTQNPISQPSYITVKNDEIIISGWDTTPWDTTPWDSQTEINLPTIASLQQWIGANNWVYKADITDSQWAIAQRAQAPIIEFEPNLELNEWIYTTYNWQYRPSVISSFISTTFQPTRFEIEPIKIYTLDTTRKIITLDERYGDLTNIFIPGYTFNIAVSTAGPQTVVSSSYQRSSLPAGSFQTRITLTNAIPSIVNITPDTNFLQPETTSVGDAWIGYGQQWLFAGINTTTAINHQAENNMMTPNPASYVVDDSGNYGTTFAPYAEQFTLLQNNITQIILSTSYVPSGSTRTLQQRSLVGFNDIRVYLNGIRQYGTYDEDGSLYVTGITFHEPLVQQDIVLIEVGEAAYSDFGNYAVPVRTILDDTTYLTDGNQLVSLVQYRLNEQVRSTTNQYPLFDIYLTNSQSADIANEIFGYHDDSSGILYPYLNQRVVTRADGSLEFQNFLVQTNNGMMYAYRNYNQLKELYWFNPNTQQLLVWNTNTWASKYETLGVYAAPLVLSTLPNPASTPIGTLVFNTSTNILYQRVNISADWSVLPVTISTTDKTLETVWRHGLNNEQEVPAQVDWLQRSYPEYQTQYNAFITATITALQQATPSLTTVEATTQANALWTAMQDNYIQPEWYTDPNAVREGPLWVGEWQVPDPLYYNVSHWDYQYLSTRDLYTHFESIIDAQPPVTGYTAGNPATNWTLIDYTDINWGLGGTIHEYDNSFDTFLSAEFINTVTPPSLFSFAQSEYENAIVTLNQLFQRNAVLYLTATDTATIQNPGTTISNEVITSFEENEQGDLVYGDSTTYQQATLTSPANGIKNWIATLPYFKILEKTQPYANIDSTIGLQEIVHHDGHRASYSLPPTTINILQLEIANSPDPRFPPELLGRISTTLPPSTVAQFQIHFSPNVRLGVYWLISTSNTLYRLTSINGTVLTWTIINLNAILIDVILSAEQLLFNQAPTPGILNLSYTAIEATNPTQWDQLMQQQFVNYCTEVQITNPFANSMFDATNPFTWNYKYSTTTKEPRSGIIQSGGTWQDVYQKVYGTPYPNLEPWILQGYTGKPSWWDTTFLNTNTALYGNRTWKYQHSLPIVAVGSSTIKVGPINVNQTETFNDFNQFTVYTGTTSFTYTVQSVSFANSYTTITTTTPINSGIVIGNTVAVGMWDYIVRGAIANNQPAPTVTPYSYSYVSVNISEYTFTDGTLTYGPDDVFPPYWNVFAHQPPLSSNANSQDAFVRSIFTDTTFEVQSENADYLWNDSGPVQWTWSQSTYYEYSELTVSYLMQPVRTIQQTFGINFEYINGLPIDSLTGQVFSHENTQFHGEISLTNQIILVNGINQWYVNYNRANGYDSSYSDFRAMWTGWTAPLSHLFAATIDTSSFSIDHRLIEITTADYELTMKRSPGVSNSWIDAFNVRIQSIPPITGEYENQALWLLEVDSLAPIARTISYYDVQVYDYYVNPTNSICSLYTYPMIASNNIENSFTVNGNVSDVFGGLNGASQFTVTNSSSNPTNNGTYTVNSAIYNTTTQQTVITITGIVPSNVVGGLISAINFRTLPWTTGTLVAPNATQLVPLPLNPTLQYFIIVLSPTTFQLAYNMADVTANIPIQFTSPALGIQQIGSVINTFTALGGQITSNIWTHYTIDSTRIKQFSTPYKLSGMQNWINILDGYIAYVQNQGFAFNVTGAYLDPQTGQQISWQNEMERFINWSYLQRTVRKQRQNDKYAIAVNYINSQMVYTSGNPNFATGTQVVVWAFNGGLPSPLINGMIYYIINNRTNIQLASTPSNAQSGIPIALAQSITVGQLYISQAALYLAELPTYEMNAFRNALWYSPPEGIVTNLLQGPYTDISSQQLLFDQYGRKLAPSDIRVFRQDLQTEIQFASGVYNDQVVSLNPQTNPYLNLHLGGGNIFIDTYEHVIIFNDYTVGGALIYDPFLGLNSTKFELDYFKQTPFTERPNVGGYFLSTNYNQGANIDRNLESSVEDVRYMYNVYEVPETLPIVARGRSLVDYPGTISYLQAINLTSKSQFLFWLGSLHAKGSVNAVQAFVNSRLFVTANLDQFWAYQIATFGSSAEQEYLSMLLEITDTQTNDLRLEFVRSDEVCEPGYAVNTFGDENCGYANPQSGTDVEYNTDPTFIPIATNDPTRWYNQPDQAASLVQDGGTLYFSLKPKQMLTIYPTTIGPNTFIPYGPSVVTDSTSPLYSANLTNETAVIAYTPTPDSSLLPGQQFPYTFWYWNPTNGGYWLFGGGWDDVSILPIFRNNFMADFTQLMFTLYPSGYEFTQTIPSSPSNTKEWTIPPYIPLSNSLQVFENGVQLVSGTDYVESLEQYTYPNSQVSSLLGYKLYFLQSISGSTLTVVYGASQLNSQLQFQNINTNIIQLLSQEIISNFMFTNNVPNPTVTLSMWGSETDKETQNPAKVIDELAQVVLTPVTFWDPARGYQYYQALHSIDIQTNLDPAIYDPNFGWKNIEVGKTWMDTTNLQYLPYYDPYTITNQETRFTDWGQLTDYGNVVIYQWVASPVAPVDYNALAAQQQNDSTIDESVRLSGTARQDVRYRDRTNTTAVVQESTPGTTTVLLSTAVVPTDLTGLAVNAVSTTDILYNLTVIVDGNSRTIEIFGSDLETFGDMINAINSQLSPVGATATLIGNSVVITSSSTGTASSVVINQSTTTMFQAWNNGAVIPVSLFSGFGSPVSGTGGSATSGHQNVNLSTTITANTSTGLVYTPASTTQDVEYNVSVTTLGIIADASASNNNSGEYTQLTETRQAYGSKLATFAEVVDLFRTFTNVSVATNGTTTITLTNNISAVSENPSVVYMSTDSFLHAINPLVTIVSTKATGSGSGTLVITFPSTVTNTGLAPVTTAQVNPSYSFNISIDGNVGRTITVQASDALTYGQLISTIFSQISSLGAGVQLSGNEITFTSDTSGSSSAIFLSTGTLWISGTLPIVTGFATAIPGTGTGATSGYQSSNATIPLYDGLATGLSPSSIAVPQGYSFQIDVDNVITRTVSVIPSQVATYADLIATLSPILLVYGATASLNSTGTAILIESDTTGTLSFVSILFDTLFSSITTNNGGQANYVSGVNLPAQQQNTLYGTNQTITVLSTVGFVIGSTVLFSSTGTLPTGIVQSVPYTITNINGNSISINTSVTSAGTGTVTMANSIWPTNWTLDEQVQANVDPSIDATSVIVDSATTYTFAVNDITDPTEDYANELFPVGSIVNVYVNGLTIQTQYTVTAAGFVFPSTNIVTNSDGTSTTFNWPSLAIADRVTIILPVYTPTATDLAFDPSVSDNGTVQVQWQYITNYNAVQTVDTVTQQNVFTYYFWAANVTTSTGTRESPIDASDDIIIPPTPYMFFNKLVPSQVVTNTQNGEDITVPTRFTQAIVRGLRGYVDQNDRYVLRFTRDFTLRDNLAFGTSPLQLKDTHQEWLMFRQNQLNPISQNLWDGITSAIVGYDITIPSTLPQVRVPALDRQLYDAQYGTSTQYGLGVGQAFVNGTLALSTVLAYLNNPQNNFYPIDLDGFFDTYDFDTSADIILAMNEIYTSFGYQIVNNIFFSVLQDALTTQLQYAGLMKTSAVALYGVELLDVNGVYDT